MAERKTLSEFAAAAAGQTNGNGPTCPNCGCHDLRAYRTTQLRSTTVRYRYCRHCGTAILTRQPSETIIREVDRHQ